MPGMSRGRRPSQALGEAAVIGARRGSVLPAPGGRYDMYDFLIFEMYRIVFVKVRRSTSQFCDPIEILRTYRADVARIHRVPLAAYAAREVWVRMPRGRWQFFLIRHDSVVEIHADGTRIPRAELPVPVRGPEPEADTPEEDPLGDDPPEEDPSGDDAIGGDPPTEEGE